MCIKRNNNNKKNKAKKKKIRNKLEAGIERTNDEYKALEGEIEELKDKFFAVIEAVKEEAKKNQKK